VRSTCTGRSFRSTAGGAGQLAIIHGETETGATLHEMVEKPDAGRIVDQEAVGILPDELALDVFGKVTGRPSAFSGAACRNS